MTADLLAPLTDRELLGLLLLVGFGGYSIRIVWRRAWRRGWYAALDARAQAARHSWMRSGRRRS